MDGGAAGEPGRPREDPQRKRATAAEDLNRAGLRAIAALEAAKGLLVLAAGLGLLALAHRDVQETAEHVLRQFHLNPAARYPRIFLDALQFADARLHMIALGALGYAGLRLVEAYGLWRARPWAEWFAAVAAALYIPFELYHLWLRVTGVKLALLAFNVAIVAYLSRVLWSSTHLVTLSNTPKGPKA